MSEDEDGDGRVADGAEGSDGNNVSEDEDGDGRVTDDAKGSEHTSGGLAPGMSKAQKRKARARKVEQQHGGRDPTLPSKASLRHERRFRSIARQWHSGEEEDLHMIYCNISPSNCPPPPPPKRKICGSSEIRFFGGGGGELFFDICATVDFLSSHNSPPPPPQNRISLSFGGGGGG